MADSNRTLQARNRMTRRGFIVHVGTAAALLSSGMPVLAQTPAPAIPGKEKLIVRSPRPLNLEARLDDLTSPITPYEAFFVRNNYDGPEMDPAQFVLKVDGQPATYATCESSTRASGA